MAFLELQSLDKKFTGNHVVKKFSLDIKKGEFISLLGPSGCGKTTVLRMVAGFERPDSGQIRIDGRDVTQLSTRERLIGMVFQAYALFPNLTVDENVAFGLRIKGLARSEIDQRVAEMLKLIGLAEFGHRYPYQLSGGQQQRVALARALAPRPQVLLLDEPLSALDAKIRVSLRNEIRGIQRQLGITTIFVTHDQEEALSISDQVVVMNGGVAEQAASPADIYNRPQTAFVANFVGSLNVMDAELRDPASRRIAMSGREFVVNGERALGKRGDRVRIGLRPESLRIAKPGPKAIALPATLQSLTFMGSVARATLQFEGRTITADLFSNQTAMLPETGGKVDLWFDPRDAFALAD